MKLSEYFENVKGYGVLATADSAGKGDVAMYARPHFMDEETIAFIMPDRLTHHNLQSNPHAAYLFMETGEKLSGKRLFLTKIKEEKDSDLLYAIRRKSYGDDREGRYLVYFKIYKVLPLIGAEEQEGGGLGEGRIKNEELKVNKEEAEVGGKRLEERGWRQHGAAVLRCCSAAVERWCWSGGWRLKVKAEGKR